MYIKKQNSEHLGARKLSITYIDIIFMTFGNMYQKKVILGTVSDWHYFE